MKCYKKFTNWNNTIGFNIVTDPKNPKKAYLSFQCPLGEMHNIGFPIEENHNAAFDGLKCLADHLQLMIGYEEQKCE